MIKIKNLFKKVVSVLTATVISASAALFTFSTASAAETPSNKLTEMANEMAMLINKEREELGLQPLYAVPYINDCANIRSEEVVEFFSHERPDGSGFMTVIDEDVIEYGLIAENISAGSDNAEAALDQIKNSPKHWASVISPSYTHMGIGLVYDPDSDYGWYWTQIFLCDIFDKNAEYEGQYIPSAKTVTPAGTGDVNGDSEINSFDYITLVEYIRKKKEGKPVYMNDAQLEAADCFKDGIITETDAKAMLRYILGQYTSLPVEF